MGYSHESISRKKNGMNVFLSCEFYPDGTPYKSDEVDFIKSLINR